MTQELGKRLAEIRKRNGYSQDELAQKLKVSRQSICNWESGESSPSLDYMMDMAKLYKVSLDDLINLDIPVEDLYKEKVDVDPSDIKDKKEKGDKFSWNKNGIHIFDNESGDRVDIDFNGIHINSNDFKDNKIIIEENKNKRRNRMINNVASLVDGIMIFLIMGVYLTLGFINSEYWNLFWPLVFTFEIPSALIRTFGKKEANKFPIVWICLTVYCFLGTFGIGWHPYWVIFFIIPIYYLIINSIKKIKEENRKDKIIKDAKIINEKDE